MLVRNLKSLINMFKVIFILGFIFLSQSCSDISKNEKKASASNSGCNLPCCQLSNEEIYEMSITYVEYELGIKNEFRMKLEIYGDTVLYVKLIPLRPQFGGGIDLKIKTDNCEISVFKLGK